MERSILAEDDMFAKAMSGNENGVDKHKVRGNISTTDRRSSVRF